MVPAAEFTRQSIADSLGIESDRLAAAARRCDRGYKVRTVPVGSKERRIHAPAPWLKALQANLYENVFMPLGCHEAVFNVRGRGVVANARQHVGHDYMVVLDISDCFPSTTHAMVSDAFTRTGFDADAAGLLTRLVTADRILPQGPPTSPAVLNFVLRRLDDDMTELAVGRGVVYTRYMDDLCFSGKRPLNALASRAERIVRKYGYRVNPRKRRILGPSDQRTVTGIVVTMGLNPEPEFLMALADELKKVRRGTREISVDSVRGRIAWIEALNPALAKEVRQAWRSARYCV